jgi:hypothetical protein
MNWVRGAAALTKAGDATRRREERNKGEESTMMWEERGDEIELRELLKNRQFGT